jgi:hypothetical protein
MRSHPKGFRRSPCRALLVLGCLLLAALPAGAYTIYLRDGSRLLAREKYQIENGRAIIVLQNGTTTFIAAGEIDVQRTEQANRNNLGTAVVLEDGKVTESAAPPPPPPKPTLSDLIASRSTAPRERPEVRRTGEASEASGRTPAGFVDLRTVPRSPLPQLDLAAQIQQLYRGLGVEEVAIFRGTEADRPLLEITTNSEASIFRSLEASAQVLIQLRQQRRVGALELLLMTAARDRAGQFVITPELAGELADKRADTAAFFVRHVQF